jgi:[methyl-Co(III) methanol-specific corrinoid protein]:coenzyme M methyltransferase
VKKSSAMTNEIMNQREEILRLFSGTKINVRPVFSGLIHVTAEGLRSEGLAFHEIHRNAEKMAKAAASTFKLTGLPSAVAPLDMLVEAEALGAPIDFRENGEYEFPRAAKFLFSSSKALTTENKESTEILKMGRIGLVCEAISKLKKDVGNEAVVGSLISGPYTLLLFLVEPAAMFTEMKKEPQLVLDALFHLSSFLAKIGQAYRDAGADFITIHDMGGSSAFIGPAKYEQFVLPAEKLLIEKLPKPRVLSICGNTNKSMHLLAQSGADAISVDQTNDLTASRAVLKDTLLFGNIDPVATLWQGDEAQITAAVIRAKEAGVDAIWPGCDLVLETPIQNIQALHKA